MLPLPVLEYSFNDYTVTVQRDARGIDQVHSSKKVKAYAYDVEDMVMPLHQYINDPVAHEIIHNGATFQVWWRVIFVYINFCCTILYGIICLLSLF